MRILATFLWLLLGLATAQAQCTSSLVDNVTRTSSNSTTATISGASFGTASAGRVLIDTFAGNTVPTSATIGGVSAILTTADPSTPVGLASAVVPTGTSGNLIQSYPSADEFQSDGIVSLIGALSATPTATINNPSGNSGTINVPANGCVVAFAIASAAGTWTGATAVRTDTSVFPAISIATFDNSGGAITNRTISYSTGFLIVAAAFDAGGAPPVTVTPKRTLMGIGN